MRQSLLVCRRGTLIFSLWRLRWRLIMMRGSGYEKVCCHSPRRYRTLQKVGVVLRCAARIARDIVTLISAEIVAQSMAYGADFRIDHGYAFHKGASVFLEKKDLHRPLRKAGAYYSQEHKA